MRLLLAVLRYGWALPATSFGTTLVLLVLLGGGRARLHKGVLEAYGGWPGKLLANGLPFAGPVAAITFGHVVLGVCEESLRATRAHERAHVRQYERWGALFFPAYFIASVWAWSRGNDPYRGNFFEISAREAEITRHSDE